MIQSTTLPLHAGFLGQGIGNVLAPRAWNSLPAAPPEARFAAGRRQRTCQAPVDARGRGGRERWTWTALASNHENVASSRRCFTGSAVALASSLFLITLSPQTSSAAVDAELYENLKVDNPYLLMEPAGESFRGNKGPNLQLPEELSEEDEAPEALSTRIKAKPQIDLLENLSVTELAASLLWAAFFYYGIFDINAKTNVVSQASGDLGAVRPSDFIKIKLGSLVGESQQTWEEAAENLKSCLYV